MRNHRHDNVHSDIFTPRTYQVELLDAAMRRNTIVCLGTGSGKTFIGVMLIKELAHQVRDDPGDGGKRTIYLVVSDAAVESQAKVIRMHTDLQVLEQVDAMNSWEKQRWTEEFNSNQVLVMTAHLLLNALKNDFIDLSKTNLLAFDECHYAVDDHPYVEIMTFYDKCDIDSRPRILGLTASILAKTNYSPTQLAHTLNLMEKTLQSTAETASDMIITDMHSARPKETIIRCGEYDDETGLVGELNKVLMDAIDFLEDLKPDFDEEAGEKDPRLLPKTVLIECHNILHVLGPWCAGKIAETLAKQLTKILEFEKREHHTRLLQFALTQFNMIEHFVNVLYDTYVQTIEDFLSFMSPRVLELIKILHNYKPDDNFMIIGGDNFMDMGSESDDSLNLSDVEIQSDEETDDRGKKGKSSKSAPPYVAIKCAVNEDKEKEDDTLCGIVFVHRRHTAFALNALIVELCNWDLDLFFVKSHHMTGHGIGKAGRECEMIFKYQENILRQFRHRDINLLISTSVLEEGVDVPKCNLIIRFDLPSDYRAYVQSKGRARAARSNYYLLVEDSDYEQFSSDIDIFHGIESILMSKCHSRENHTDDIIDKVTTDEILPAYSPIEEEGAAKVTMTTAIALVNKYCAKLPSDAFTHLTPKCRIEEMVTDEKLLYQAILQLPINSPIKKPVDGEFMPSKRLAKMAVALKTTEILHKAGELDNNLLPVGKEMIKYEDDENEWEDHELAGQARPGTTKRKQYYQKKIADALVGRPKFGTRCYLYYFNMTLSCPITEEQNTRGRKIHSPDETLRGFGIISPNIIPLVPLFPVFTRSGEITVSVDLVDDNITYAEEDLPKLNHFHRFVFSRVLRLEKDPMIFDFNNAESSCMIVPVTKDESDKIVIDWNFVNKIEKSPLRIFKRQRLYDPANKKDQFQFEDVEFCDAVVMPSYRNIDQPQYFYVAEIRHDLNPKCPFPSPELYDTFERYYTSKYGLEITNLQQPLLDVDHTSARLNLLTPRYMNQKGVALPTSSAETRRARRENLQQKQILIPELCDIHPFPASLWRKAVCLPAIIYRMNYLLIAEELRVMIADEAHIGIIHISEDFRFPDLEFGFSTKPQSTADEESEKSDSDDGKEPLEIENGHNGEEKSDSDDRKEPLEIENGHNGEEKSDSDDRKEPLEIENGHNGEEKSDTVLENGNEVSSEASEITQSVKQEESNGIKEDKTETSNGETPSPTSSSNETPDEKEDNEICSKELNVDEVADSIKMLELNHLSPGTNGVIVNSDKTESLGLKNCSNNRLSNDSTDIVSKSEPEKASTVILKEENILTNANHIPANSLEQQGDNLSTSNLVNGHAAIDESGAVAEDNTVNTDKMLEFDPTDPDSGEIRPTTGSTSQSDDAKIKEEFVEPYVRFDQETNLKTFVGPSPCTILQTLTMSNANDFFNLERLETIGDSFLKFAITVYLYCTYPGIHEGKLSYLRSKQVSNYNLYKLGKKKAFPDCMVAAKFEPTENWLPPGYIIKKDGAFKGLSVRIASKLRKPPQNQEEKSPDKQSEESASDNPATGEKEIITSDVTPNETAMIKVEAQEDSTREESKDDINNVESQENITQESEEDAIKVESDVDITREESEEGASKVESEVDISEVESEEDMQKRFQRELLEAINMEEERTDPQELMKSLIPYNLQTQHSLPDKSIADCVEALIGCYLTTCGQRAALQFMSWLGLKVLPDSDEINSHAIHHGNNLRDILQGNSIKIGFPNGSRNKTVGFGKLQPPPSPLLFHVPNAHGILDYYLDGYEAFEKQINYKFNDRSYLLQAFSHASYHYNTVTDCYQRLEFLGDAILDYVITRHLFEDSQKHSPGVLTDLRSALVNNNIFAALAVKWDFHKYFKAVSPQLFSVIEKFVSWLKDNFDQIYMEDEPEEGENEDDYGIDEIEDIEIPKALGDIFESVAGAIYLDSGMSLDVVWRVYYRMMKPQIDAFTEKIPKSPVRELLEMEPETAKFEKPERTMDGKIRVTVNVVGKGSYRGIGRNYRIAKSAAAKRALKTIKSLPNLGAMQTRKCNCPCQRMQQEVQMHMHPH